MPWRRVRLMSISRSTPATRNVVRMKTLRVPCPPESTTVRSSTTGAVHSIASPACAGVSRNPTHGAPRSLKRHWSSTCSAELRAPLSILARIAPTPSVGSATHSRQPSTTFDGIDICRLRGGLGPAVPGAGTKTATPS